MKLRPDQLHQAIKNTLAPVYLISGDVPLLVQECRDLIKTTALKAGHSDVQCYSIEHNFDWNVLIFDSQNVSLFGEKKLIEIKLGANKPDDTGKRFLIECTEKPDADTVILLTSEKLDSATQRSNWYKALEAKGLVIQVWPIDSDKLPQWIHQRMVKAGLVPTQTATQIIAEKTEGNLLAAVQEIEKLRLLYGEGALDEAKVLAAISDCARYDVFQLVETAQQGNVSKSLKILEGLRLEGHEPTLILWALCRELRTLAHLSARLELGHSLQQLFQEQRIWDKRKLTIQSYLKRMRYQDTLKLIKMAQDVDLAIKGLEKNDPWLALNQLVIAFCADSAHPRLPASPIPSFKA